MTFALLTMSGTLMFADADLYLVRRVSKLHSCACEIWSSDGRRLCERPRVGVDSLPRIRARAEDDVLGAFDEMEAAE